MLANAPAPVAIAAITQDRALIGLLRSVIDPANDLILVNSEADLVPHLHSRRVSVTLLDSMFIEGDLAGLAERLRSTWPDLVLVVVGTAEEQSKVASQITSGVVYRFLHRPVSAPRVRLFVEAALRRHEVENVERTLEQVRPDFSRMEAAASDTPQRRGGKQPLIALGGVALAAVTVGAWYLFSGGRSPDPAAPAEQVVSSPTSEPATTAVAEIAPPEITAPAPEPAPAEPAVTSATPEPAASDDVAATLRMAGTVSNAPSSVPATAPPAPPQPATETPAESRAPVQRAEELPVEAAPPTPPSPAPLTHQQRLDAKLAEAELALQRGELASPPGRSAVDLFREALQLDPSNALAKAGLVRVADRLLGAAERALTAGNPEDAKKMVDVAETLTPATARGAFLMMQIEMERERRALTAKRNADAQNRLEVGSTYLRVANARLRSGALIEPPQDNARFYLEAARQTIPDDPGVAETTRLLRKELLGRASAAASAGNAAETERWLANADATGAPRQEMTNIRRMLQDQLIDARGSKVATLTQQFNAALSGGRLVQPAETSAKTWYFELVKTDAASQAVASARQALGRAYLARGRDALSQGDLVAAADWLDQAHTISFSSAELNATASELATARNRAAERARVVGANKLPRIKYVAPKFPAATRNREVNGWVELEFTVRTDGSTGDIVVTNSNPAKVFDSAAVNAVEQWRYQPVIRDGRPVEQRAAIRIRFTEE